MKPNVTSQLSRPMGLTRLGGMASRGSTAVPPSKGKLFAGLETQLLKGKAPNPKRMAMGKPGRQYSEESGGIQPSSDKKIPAGPKGPVMRAQKAKQHPGV